MSTNREASTSAPSAAGLFDGILARGGVHAQVDDRAWLQAMLDFEAALARAEARAGVIDAKDAEAIATACEAGRFDVAEIGRAAAMSGTPVVPMVEALSDAVEGPARRQVHRGATSQDVMDSAAMLVARRAAIPLFEDLSGAADAAASLAAEHRDTLMVGRTLLQHALPVTFGLVAAGWLSGLDRARRRLAQVRGGLVVQLGGAVGTLASLGDAGPAVLANLADELELNQPVLPWHTERSVVTELAGALGTCAAAAGKPATDVILLAQTEVAEVREGVAGRGGSSTLPHKSNPVAAVCARASAQRAPVLAAALLEASEHEHQRAAGSWHAEWKPLADLLVAAGSSAAWLRDCLENLEVDSTRMKDNLELTGGLVLAERVTTALAPELGRLEAHDLVKRASRDAVAEGRSLNAVLSDSSEVREFLDEDEIERLLDPRGYLGSARTFVDAALRAHQESGGPLPVI